MNGKYKITGFHLKIIATITMVIDHIGVLYPDISFLRWIGRISFPIFAFLLSEGYHYTKNKKKYFLNLLIFAFLSEIPYNLFFFNSPFSLHRQNIFFTLSFAFISLFLYEKLKENKKTWLAVIILFLLAFSAQLLKFDYGAFGVLFIFSFHFHYFYAKEIKIKKESKIIGKIKKFFLPILVLICFEKGLPWSIFSFIFLLLYDGERGKKVKYFFYAFYPVHFLLISFLTSFLS